LALAGVDAHLRADGHRARAIATRDEVALDAHMAEHLLEIAAIAVEERLEDLLALVRETTAHQPLRRRLVDAGSLERARHDVVTRGGREEEQRMIADLVVQLRVDEVFLEVRERAVLARAPRLAAKADRGLDGLGAREHPVESVERALVERGV